MTDRSAVATRTIGSRATLLGPNDSLENVTTWELDDGARCYVVDQHTEYQLQRDSTDAPSPPDIIQPNAGPGRWKVQHSGGGAQGAQGATGPQGFQGAIGQQGSQGSGFQGAQGATGSQGAQGAQGFQGGGFQGAQGSTGSQGPGGGAQGAQGATGVQGFQGAQGNTGAQGAQGNQGATGTTGTTGAQGAQGATGAAGTTGAQGAQGSQGATGQQGFQGAVGATGTTGAQGAQGFQGATGVQGFQGAQGSGFQGAQGSQGAVGPGGGAQGAQGATGAQGAQGFQGQGFQGAQGATGTAGATGTQGFQGAQGRQGNTGAQGATGATGTTGAQGAQGATGTAGASGAQGFQGATGAAGTTGAQGAQGATGATGGTGTTGAQGAQGFQGAQGRQGNTGNTGAQGSTGFQGAQGNTGAQGAQGLFGPLTQFFYVDSANSGAADGSIARPYASPTAALAAHPTGNITLAIAAGSYGALTVTGARNVTLIGLCEPADSTVILGAISIPSLTNTLTMQNIACTSITDSSATITGITLIDVQVSGNITGSTTSNQTYVRMSTVQGGWRGSSVASLVSINSLLAETTTIGTLGALVGTGGVVSLTNCPVGNISAGPVNAWDCVITGAITSQNNSSVSRYFSCLMDGDITAGAGDNSTCYLEGCVVGSASATATLTLGPWGILDIRNTTFGPKSTGAISLSSSLTGLRLDSVSERSLFSSTQGRGIASSSSAAFVALDEPEGNAIPMADLSTSYNFNTAARLIMTVTGITANRAYDLGLTGSQALEILPIDIYGTNGHTVTITFNSSTIKQIVSTDPPARYFFQASEDDAILVYTGKEPFQ